MKKYQMPDFTVAEYETDSIIAMSWSDEETGEALAGRRDDASANWEDDFWDARE